MTESTLDSSQTGNSPSSGDYLKRPLVAARNSWRVEQCRRSLREFLKAAWPLIEPSPLVWGLHVDAICEHLEAVTRGKIQNLLITLPPRHSKSTIVSVVWPCWEWIDHPARRWLFASYAESLAIRDNVRSRRLIQSMWYQANWGERFQFAGDQNEKRKVETDRGGHRIAVGTGGSATGEGGDRLVIDDPHNVAEIESMLGRKATLDWFDMVWSTRANDPKTTARVIIMQRSHEEDLAGHVLQRGGWEHLSLPAEYEGDARKTAIGWRDPRQQQGELLWPARFGPAQIAETKKTLGSYGYSAQYQQRPSPAGGGLFERVWFKYWHPANTAPPPVEVRTKGGEIRRVASVVQPRFVQGMFQSWDLAFKGENTSDYVVGQLWSINGADRYLMDQRRGQWSFPATRAQIVMMCREWPGTQAILVEDKANGSAIIAELQHTIGRMLPVNPEGGKLSRAHAVSALVEAGNVYVPHPATAPWVEEFLEECTMFPAGRHDDQVDAMTQALRRVQGMEPQVQMFLDPETGVLVREPPPRLSISPI